MGRADMSMGSEARDELDAHIYAPARGLEAANANFWAAIQRAEDT